MKKNDIFSLYASIILVFFIVSCSNEKIVTVSNNDTIKNQTKQPISINIDLGDAGGSSPAPIKSFLAKAVQYITIGNQEQTKVQDIIISTMATDDDKVLKKIEMFPVDNNVKSSSAIMKNNKNYILDENGSVVKEIDLNNNNSDLNNLGFDIMGRIVDMNDFNAKLNTLNLKSNPDYDSAKGTNILKVSLSDTPNFKTNAASGLDQELYLNIDLDNKHMDSLESSAKMAGLFIHTKIVYLYSKQNGQNILIGDYTTTTTQDDQETELDIVNFSDNDASVPVISKAELQQKYPNAQKLDFASYENKKRKWITKVLTVYENIQINSPQISENTFKTN